MALLLACPVFLGSASGAVRTVTIVNGSPQPMDEFYAAPVAARDGPGMAQPGDLLAAGGVEPGGSFRIAVEGCAFDLSAVYEDGRRETKRSDLCRERRVAFDGAGAVAGPVPGDHVMVLVNASPRAIARLFVSPPNAPAWRASRLGGVAVPPDGSADLTFNGPCRQDVRVVFDNAAAEERRDVDLCARPELRVAPGWTTAPDRADEPAAARDEDHG